MCGSKITSKSARYDGALLYVDYTCSVGHQKTWRSGQSKHHQPLINVEVACSAKMSGIGYTELQEFSRLLQMPVISNQTFYSLVNKWFYPVVAREYSQLRTNILADLRSTNEELIVCGDAQFDSPGFSAKFCTYITMKCSDNRVLDLLVIQKGQYQGELERQACQELLTMLTKDDLLQISKFVNDRHQGIGKLMREEFPNIHHAYDVWHLAKSLQKKLNKAAKSHPKIAVWHRQIINHLWWSCENCKKNPELLLEMFHSVLFHVLNIHQWSRKRLVHDKFAILRGKRPYPKKPQINPKCWHAAITRNDKNQIKWFQIDDPDFTALFKLLTGTKFSNDLKKCSEFLHTGSLESLHSTKIKYLPKSTAYSMTTNIVMTMFAVLVHDELLHLQATKEYQVAEYSRASKGFCLKTRKNQDIIPFKRKLLAQVVLQVISNEPVVLDLSRYLKRPVPKTFHGLEKPSTDDLKKKRFSRMGKS